MLETVSRLLLELHRDCREPAVDDFPRWAMDLLDSAIRHDACFWGSGCQVDGETVANSCWFKNVPRESMDIWEQNKHLDTIPPILFEHPGRVINVTIAEFRSQHARIHEVLYGQVNVSQMLCTYRPNAATGVFDALSLYRSDPAAAFSEEERLAFECLVPNLVEARRANYLSRLSSESHWAETGDGHLAAADKKGVLHAIDENFTALMNLEWPGWQGPRLPAPIGAQLSDGRGRYVGDAIVIVFEPALDITLLQARGRQPVDKLSGRQIAIARAFAQGDSHKEIARSLNLAPATVRNHLSAIYGTLGIGSKAELATLLARQALKAPPR